MKTQNVVMVICGLVACNAPQSNREVDMGGSISSDISGLAASLPPINCYTPSHIHVVNPRNGKSVNLDLRLFFKCTERPSLIEISLTRDFEARYAINHFFTPEQLPVVKELDRQVCLDKTVIYPAWDGDVFWNYCYEALVLGWEQREEIAQYHLPDPNPPTHRQKRKQLMEIVAAATRVLAEEDAGAERIKYAIDVFNDATAQIRNLDEEIRHDTVAMRRLERARRQYLELARKLYRLRN